MTHYLLSVHSVEGEVREPMTDEERTQSHKQLGVLEQELKSAGAWVVSGRLHDPSTATVVRIAAGEVLTTDGPFVESKEHLGGFYLIEAEVGRIVCEEYGRSVAALVRVLGDITDPGPPDEMKTG